MQSKCHRQDASGNPDDFDTVYNIPEFFGLQQTPREHLLPRQIHALTPARSKYSHPAKIFRKIRGLEIKKKKLVK